MDAPRRIPSNPEAEKAALGSVLVFPERAAGVLEQLQPLVRAEDFYVPAHKEVYQAMSQMLELHLRIDLTTLADHLREADRLGKIGGLAGLADLASEVPTTENAAHYARIVARDSARRRLLRLSEDLRAAAWADGADPEVISADAIRRLEDLSAVSEDPVISAAEVDAEVMDRMQERTQAISSGQDVAGLGVPTGFPDLDHPERGVLTFGGLPVGNVTALCAPSSHGKSSLAVDIGSHVAVELGWPVLDCSLEDKRQQRHRRLLVHLSGVSNRDVQDERVSPDDWPALQAASRRVRPPSGDPAPLYYTRRRGQTVEGLCALARAFCRRHQVRLWIVDYLQKLATERAFHSRNDRAEYTLRQIIHTAEALPDCATLLVSTLRDGDYSTHIAQMADIPYDKAQVYDLHTILTLNRPKKAGDLPGSWLNVAKQKDGPSSAAGPMVGVVLGHHEQTASYHDPDSPRLHELLRRGGCYTDSAILNLRQNYETAMGAE